MTFKQWSKQAQADRDRIGARDVSPIAGMSLRSKRKREAGEDMASSYEQYQRDQAQRERERQAQYEQMQREYNSLDFDALNSGYDSWASAVNSYLRNPTGNEPDSSSLSSQTSEIRDFLHKYGGILEGASDLYAGINQIDDEIAAGERAMDRDRLYRSFLERQPQDPEPVTSGNWEGRTTGDVRSSYPENLDDQVQQAYYRWAEAEGIFNNYSGNDPDRMNEMMRDMDAAKEEYDALLEQQERRDRDLKNAEDADWFADMEARFGDITSMPDFVVDEDVVRQHRILALNDIGGATGLIDPSRMTDEEVAAFGYVYGHEGKEAAEDYLRYISHAVNERATEEADAAQQDFATKHPFASSILSIPQNIAGGIVGAVDLAGQYLDNAVTGEPVDYNSPGMAALRSAQISRGTVAENIDNGILSTAYQIGMSIVDNAAAAAVQATTGIPAAAILSTGAGASAAQAAKERGGSDGQALVMGLLAGAAEQIFETKAFESLFSIGDPNTTRGVVRDILHQMGVEAGEEAATSVANTISDAVVMMENSEVQQSIRAYMDSGMSEEEAQKQAFLDLVMGIGVDALAGAVSGGVLGGGATIINRFSGRNGLSSLANQIDRETQMQTEFGTEAVQNSVNVQPMDIVRENSAQYGDQALAMESTYMDGQDPVQYAADYNTAFEYGRNGASRETLPASSLTADQMQVAYDAGRTSSRRDRQASADSGFIRNAYSDRVSESDAAYLDALGKASGTRIQIGEASGENGYNGYYKDGVITIAEDASDSYAVVAAHEVTHRMKEAAPAQYREYSQYAMRILGKTENLDDLIAETKAQYEASGITLTDEQATDEIAANFTQDLMTNVDGFRELANTNRNIAQRLLSSIRSFIQKVKSYFSGDRRSQNKAAMEAYGVGIGELENAAKRWGGALKNTGKNISGLANMKPTNIVDTNRKTGTAQTANSQNELQQRTADPVFSKMSQNIEGVNAIDNTDQQYSIRRNFDVEYLRNIDPSSIQKQSAREAVERFQRVDGQRQNTQKNLDDVWSAMKLLSGQQDQRRMDSLKKNLDALTIQLQNQENNVTLAMRNPEVRSILQAEHRRVLGEMSAQYGTIPAGENPAREVSVPLRTSKNQAVGRFARTAMEASSTPDYMISEFEREIVNGTFSHTIESDEKAVEYAQRHIELGDAMAKWDAVVHGNHMASKNDIALGESLYIQAAQAGDTETAMRIAAELCAEATRAGQVLQSIRLLKKMPGVGQLYYIDRVVSNMQNDLERRLGNKAPELQVPDSLRNRLANAMTGAEQDAAMEEIKNQIAAQMPTTWMDKWNAWRYFAMLGNPRTHFRNIVGNAVFEPAVRIKGFVQSGIEAGAQKAGIISRDQRTSVARTKREYRDFASRDFEEVKDILTGGGRNFSNDIRDRVRIFKNRALESARRANFNALEFEDGIFLKRHYTYALANVLQARGIDVTTLDTSNPTDMQRLLDARTVAIREAQKATYRDASSFATAINRLSRTNKATALVVESLLPFKKTPINVLKRGVEYSPVQLFISTGKMIGQLLGKQRSATEIIDGFASGLTGTGIMLLGSWLASMDLLSGGYGDEPEDDFDQLTGGQEYAFKIGDSTYTVDWAAPAALPLFVGVELWNTTNEEYDGISFSDIGNAFQLITEPMFNLSMLDGLNDVLSSLSFSEGDELTTVATEMLTSYIGQAMPTILGQIARTIDPVRRTSYTDKDSQIPSWLQYFLDQQQNRIPGATFMSQPFLDEWGREQTTQNLLERAFENFMSPGYMSSYNVSDMERELQRIYEETADKTVFPKSANRSPSISGQKISLSGDEFITYQTSLGQTSYNILTEMVKSSAYQRLPDEYKIEAIDDAYTIANELAKVELVGSSSRIQDILSDAAKEKDSSARRVQEYTPTYKWQQELVGKSVRAISDYLIERAQDSKQKDDEKEG